MSLNMKLIIIAISALVTALIIFVFWEKFFGPAAIALARGVPGALSGLVLNGKRKKGTISVSTELMIGIVLAVSVGLILFLIFAGVGGETQTGVSGFLYGIFDWIIGSLPTVSQG